MKAIDDVESTQPMRTPLSPRQREIASLVAQGFPTKAIAVARCTSAHGPWPHTFDGCISASA